MDFDGNDFSAQVQDDPRFHDYNLDQFVAQFINNAVQQAQNTRTEHIIWAMGCVV
jgi:alpha-mannosidase